MSDAFLDLTQLDIIPAMLAYWDRELRCRYANRAYCDFMGRSAAELIGRSIPEVLGKHYGHVDQARVAAVLRGEPQTYEVELSGRDGEPTYLQVRYTPHSVDGEIHGFNVMGIDITERHRAELELADRERKLRDAQRIAGLGYWSWDLRTGTSTWTDELFRIYGRDPALGAPSYEELRAYYEPDDQAQLARLVKRALDTGESYTTLKGIHRHDGSRAWVETHNEVIRDGAGTIIGLRGAVLDVTARREAELALNEAQRLAGVGSWEWTRATKKLTWSDEMFRLYGCDPAHGTPTLEDLAAYSATSHALLVESAKRTIATGHPFLIEQSIIRPDGRTVWLVCQGEAIRDDVEAIVGIRGTMTDITSRKQSELALARSEAALVEAQRIAGVGSWYWDVSSDHITWSDEMYRICDRDRDRPPPHLEELCEHYAPESHSSLVAKIQRAVEHGEPYSQEAQLHRRDGTVVYVVCRGEALADTTGKVTALHGTITDVTARKTSELALATSENDLREAQRIAHVGSWQLDVESSTFTWSDEMYRIFGRDPALGVPTLEELAAWYTPEDHQRIRADLARAISTGAPYSSESAITRPDGTVAWIKRVGELIRDATGKTIAIRGTTIDITERKHAELALARSEAALREAQRIAHVGSWNFDRATRHCTWSDELFRIYGMDPSRGEVQFDDWAQYHAPEAYARFRADVGRALETGEPYSHELPLTRPDGRVVWVRRDGEALRDARGEITGLRGTVIDITERKVAELALAQTAEELQQAQRIAHVGSWDFNVQTGESTWSEELFRIYGIEPTHPAPSLEHMEAFYTPETYTRLRGDIAHAIETGETYSHEIPLKRPDGRTVWVRRTGEVRRDERGVVVGVRGTTIDITERKEAELERERSQAALLEAQRIAGVGSWELDLLTGKTTWSDEMYRIYGRSPALAPPRPDELAQYMSEGTHAQLMRNVQEALGSGEATSLEICLKRPDGTTRWVLGRGEGYRDETGHIVGVRGTVTDIHARKQAELALLAREADLHNAQRLAGLGSWTWDRATHEVTWSEETYRIFGRDPADGPPTMETLRENYSPEVYAGLVEKLERLVSYGEPYELETPMVVDGVQRWVFRQGMPVRDEEGNVVGAQGTALDITERKRAELALRASEHALREAQRIAGVGSWEWDIGTGKTMWTDEVYRIYGRRPEQGPPSIDELATMCSPDTYRQIRADLDTVVATGQPFSHEVELTIDGNAVWVKRSGEPMYGNDGTIVGVRGTTMDVTHRKLAELALRTSEHALREAQRIAGVGSWQSIHATGAVEWSDETYRIVGRDPKLGPPSFEELAQYFPRDVFEQVTSDLVAALTHGIPFARELPMLRSDGTSGWIHQQGEPLRDETGTIIGVRGTTMDITAHKDADAALRASEQALRDAQRIAHVGSWSLDRASGKTTWSDEVFRIYGLDPAGAPPRVDDLRQIYELDNLDELRHDIDRALAGGSYLRERRIRRPDGSHAWVVVRGEPLRDGHGEIVGVHGTAAEITERKRAELALQDSEAALREAQRIARLGSWDWDIVTGTVTWSESLRVLLGWPLDEPAPTFDKQASMFAPDSWAILEEVVNAAILEGHGFDIDLELSPLPGTRVRWVRSRCEVVRDASGKTTSLHGILLDITEQRVADTALRDSEARYALIARNTQDVIWLYDLEHERFEYVSPAIRGMLGLALDEELDLVITDVLPPAALSSALARGDTTPQPMYEMRMHRADGTDVPVEVSLTLVRGDGDRVTHVQGVTRDVSSRKQLEQQVLQLQKMESVGRLAGGIAHDFNNLLTVIMGQLEFVVEELPHDSEHAEALRDAMTAATRSAELTRQLLAFARQQKILPRVLDINDEIDRGTTMLRRLVGENIELAWVPGPSTWSVKLDPTQIHQLLANLIVNARDAISGHGSIRITTRNDVLDEEFCATHPGARPGSYVQLAVSDTGCGMSPEIRARVFEPFFTTKDPARGTGLGLSIVYGVVSQNHGYIDVESTPGAGSTFRLWFPRTEGDAQKARTGGDIPRGNETLLVVEDERAVLALTRDMLKRLGYKVLTANSPGEALETFASHGASVDLVLTDVVMPQMNGRELTTKLQELRPDVPCLYMSGYTADVATRSGDIDMERLLQKPFTLPELARAVRQVLAQRPITS